MYRICVVALMFALVSAPAIADGGREASILGVLFYADWCGSYRVLDPAIEKARGQADLDNESILFVRLDLTDATRRHQAGLMAHKLGLGDFFRDNAGATGFMLLVEAHSGKIVRRITKDIDAGQIAGEVHKAMAQVVG